MTDEERNKLRNRAAIDAAIDEIIQRDAAERDPLKQLEAAIGPDRVRRIEKTLKADTERRFREFDRKAEALMHRLKNGAIYLEEYMRQMAQIERRRKAEEIEAVKSLPARVREQIMLAFDLSAGPLSGPNGDFTREPTVRGLSLPLLAVRMAFEAVGNAAEAASRSVNAMTLALLPLSRRNVSRTRRPRWVRNGRPTRRMRKRIELERRRLARLPAVGTVTIGGGYGGGKTLELQARMRAELRSVMYVRGPLSGRPLSGSIGVTRV